MEQAMAINKILVEQQIAAGTLKLLKVSAQDWTPEQNVNDLLLTIQLQVDALFRNYNVKRLRRSTPQILNGFNKETKQYFVREFRILFTVTKPSLSILYDTDIHQALWLTSIVSDQLLFYRKSDLDYTTYYEILKIIHRIGGKYRFTFNTQIRD